MRVNFQLKRTTLTFLAQICPKKKLGFEIQKANVGIRISILEILCAPIFRQNGQPWIFGPKFAQKWILGKGFQKSKSGFGINTSNILCVPIFSQIGQLLIFRPKFGEITQLRAIFGSNIVEGAAESWVEADMGSVEVDRAGWRLKWAGWRWMELGGVGWRWVELGGGGCTV